MNEIKQKVLDEEDKVNHPNHYNQGNIETLDYIDDNLGEFSQYYYIGNILKYLSRYRFKNGIEDLEKAKFYLDRLIKQLKGEQ